MSKFKIGDKVIGNKLASDKYSITKEGYIGYVISVLNDETIIISNNKNGKSGYKVEIKYFDLVEKNKSVKSLLKNGDILETNNKDYYIYFQTDDSRNLITVTGGHMCLDDYDEKLILDSNIDSIFTFKKIYRFDYLGNLIKFINGERNLDNKTLIDNPEVIWERKEAKEMTIAEISEKLGYEVKVVK